MKSRGKRQSICLQYGCGLCAPDAWLNFDASPTLRLQRLPLVGRIFAAQPRFPIAVQYGDIVRGLPVSDESCDAIYCSHILEHLSIEDFRCALENTHSLLRPGGRFRLVVPDLEALATDYLRSKAADASVRFMEESYLGVQGRPRDLKGLLQAWLGNSKHLWMWDYKSIERELASVGFQRIRRAEFGDSGDPAFEAVEDVGRWDGCLGVECFRAAAVHASDCHAA